MAKRPTEEELGIAPTAEEQEVLSRPITQIDDSDDIRPEEEVGGENNTLVQAKPKPETAPEARATISKDPLTGKFVASKAAEAGEAALNGTKPPAGYVEHGAFHQEREGRKALAAENKVLMERMATLAEVLAKRDAPKVDKPAEAAIPDKNVDPLGYMEHMEQRLGKIEGESKAQTEARQASEREQAEVQEALNVAVPQFNEAVKTDPTLPALQSALLESFAREIAFVNRIDVNNATPQQRQFVEAELGKLERGHIQFAVKSGINVVEYMKNLASVRNVSAAPVQQQQAPQTQQRTIADRQKAQDRHMSVGDLPGSALPASVSAKDLVKMSNKEFAAFAKKMGDPGMDDLMSKI